MLRRSNQKPTGNYGKTRSYERQSNQPKGEEVVEEWRYKLFIMKVMSFNVRGLGKKMKRKEIRRMIHNNGIEMCCIQETKMEKTESWIGRELWGRSNYDWVYRDAEGRSGGLISIWNSGVFSKSSSWHTKGLLVVKGRWLEDSSVMLILNVYAPCNTTEKVQLWEILQVVTEQYEEYRICVAGDFNSIREENERIGRG
ncbi:hypothetical protein ACS0TY_024521 [Phlomoides rotata]